MPEDDIPERPEVPYDVKQRHMRYLSSKDTLVTVAEEDERGTLFMKAGACFLVAATVFSVLSATSVWPGHLIIATVLWGLVLLDCVCVVITAITATSTKEISKAKAFIREYEEYELGDYNRLKMSIAEWDLEYG